LALGEDQNVKATLDQSESGEPLFAILSSVVAKYDGAIQIEVLDYREIDAMFLKVGSALCFTPDVRANPKHE